MAFRAVKDIASTVEISILNTASYEHLVYDSEVVIREGHI